MRNILKGNGGFFPLIAGPIIGAMAAGGAAATATAATSGLTAALIGGGATIGGSLVAANSAKSTNEAQKEQAQKQMDFQQTNSDTAHQREVKDLYAAGLNPILSAKYGGASTPSGSVAQLENPYNDLSSDINSAVNSFHTARLNNAQINNIKSQAMYNSALTQKTKAETAILKREEGINREIGTTKQDSYIYRTGRRFLQDIKKQKLDGFSQWQDRIKKRVRAKKHFGVTAKW